MDRTGSSKLATARRFRPNTLKKASQNDFASAVSRVSSAHSREKATARALISFQLSGMGKKYQVIGGLHRLCRKSYQMGIAQAEGSPFSAIFFRVDFLSSEDFFMLSPISIFPKAQYICPIFQSGSDLIGARREACCR